MRSPLLFLALLISLTTLAQSDINNEEFQLSYLTKDNSAQFLYNGKAHAFSIDIVADSIKTTEYPNYVIVDKRIVQVSAIPLQPTIIDLSGLTIDQQKGALSGYVDYETDYFKNELKLDCQNIKKEWIFIDSKLWLIWSFDVVAQDVSEQLAQKTKSQVYSSTICFNQVLDLNVPVFQNDDIIKIKVFIADLMSSLKMFDRHL
ncbi:MAG TPA: hypothetical protein VNT20_00770 [Flavisolibacter sp.]|jgi:hypothetical protein|nr:hypothetical protein [Flavisolibacter sp.]